MTTVSLGRVCRQDRKSIQPGDGQQLRYVGLESIESATGQLADGELSKTPDAPRAISFSFDNRHVLYGKLRPYLNKVLLPDFKGKCSTEIIPLLPNPELERGYLAYFLRCRHTVEQIAARTAGARMPRADMNFVLSMPIALCSLSEQRRIVDLLSRAEGIVRLRREAEKKAAELIPALFIDLFGDPATNPRGWSVHSLGELIESALYGTSTKASAEGSGLPVLRMGNVDYAGNVDVSDLKHVVLSDNDVEKYRLRSGDILFNRTNSKDLVGKTGFWAGPFEAVAASYFIRVRVDRAKTNPHFIWAFMNSRYMKRVLFETARGAIGQANINAKELKAFRVAAPPLQIQERFECYCREVTDIQTQQSVATAKAQAAFDALLHRFFGAPA